MKKDIKYIEQLKGLRWTKKCKIMVKRGSNFNSEEHLQHVIS